jgi:hypothetical protein
MSQVQNGIAKATRKAGEIVCHKMAKEVVSLRKEAWEESVVLSASFQGTVTGPFMF